MIPSFDDLSRLQKLITGVMGVLVIGVELGCIAWKGYQYGHDVAQRDGDKALSDLKAAVAAEKLQLAQQQSRELGAALLKQQEYNQQAQQASTELLQAIKGLGQTQQQIKRSIDDATKHDGSAFTGIGPDSLRLYRTALGYRAECVQGANGRDAGHAGETGCTDSGLPPSDLLAHASDYGAWCQALEAKLRTLNQFYSPQKQEQGRKP